MSRAQLWIISLGLLGCAEGTVAEMPTPSPDMRESPPDPQRDARPMLMDALQRDVRPPDDAQIADVMRLSDGMTPDARRLTPDVAPPIPDAAPPVPDAAPPVPDMQVCSDEICNGIDDDCDAQIDEGAGCGQWVEQNCIVYAGWTDKDLAPAGVAQTWGQCPPNDHFEGNVDLHCTGTRGSGRFARLRLGGNVNSDDSLGIALRCVGAADSDLPAYVQSHCALYMGWADGNRGLDRSLVWGACPGLEVSNQGLLHCTSTGYDGNFRALDLEGGVDDNDDLGFAWLCEDNDDPARAAMLSASVSVFVGWADNNRAPADRSLTWGPCPGQPSGFLNNQRCVSTQGDRLFHRLDLDGNVDENDALGFALKAR